MRAYYKKYDEPDSDWLAVEAVLLLVGIYLFRYFSELII